MPVRKWRAGWQVDVQVDGRRIRRTAATRALALELERKIREDADRQRFGLKPHKTLEDALAEHLSTSAATLKARESLLSVARVIRPYLTRPIDRIAEAASEIIRDGLKAGRAPATINRHLALLRRLGNMSVAWGWTDSPVGKRVQLLPEHNERHVYLTREQVEALAAQAHQDGTRDAIRLAAYTGLRRGELLALGPQNWRDGALWLSTSKNGRPRRVPVPREAWDICERLPIKATRYTLRDDFDRARKAIGMPHIHFHDLRHTYASWLIQAGADLLAVKHLLGHSTMQMTSRYAHLEDRQLTKAVRRISGDGVVTQVRQKRAKNATKDGTSS